MGSDQPSLPGLCGSRVFTRQFLPGYFQPRLAALSAKAWKDMCPPIVRAKLSSAFLFKDIYETSRWLLVKFAISNLKSGSAVKRTLIRAAVRMAGVAARVYCGVYGLVTTSSLAGMS